MLGDYQVAAAKHHFNADRPGLKLCTAISRPETHPAAGMNMEAHERPETPAFIVTHAPGRSHRRNSFRLSRRPQCRHQMVWRADSSGGPYDGHRGG
ncbi:hypothetical protein AGR7B_Cc70121 [Agrobacterium deltaense RV3]|nr:hypothetical protein AGR7B_Cc70121 [Agrobacterium deltaense RV3]